MFDAVAPVLGDGSAGASQRFQQTSGMVMAKGVEDCAFYRWSRLTSLNEVGGDPSVFAVDPVAFHDAMATRQAERPHAMTAASTHDTKRAEDVRARIAVLAEVPEVWERALDRLLELAPLPDPGFGNLLWQAVVGAWSDDPALRDRLHAYAEKAMREAGDRTTWTAPDEAYERAVHAAVDAAFDDERVRGVLDEVLLAVGDAGRSNALSAKLLGLTIPGVPDVYQGSELREDSLVDPDNRRPVDFEARARMVAEERPGHPKLRLVREALRLRRDRPELFTSYAPVPASGVAADHVARLRPRRRRHRRHPAPARAGRPRRLGRHHPRAARRAMARPAHRESGRQRRQHRGRGAPRHRTGRAARGAAGAAAPAGTLRGLGATPPAGAAGRRR